MIRIRVECLQSAGPLLDGCVPIRFISMLDFRVWFSDERSGARRSVGVINTEATAVLIVFRNARRRTNIGVRRPSKLEINSPHRRAAVHGEGMADHVARPRAAQPEHGRGDLLGPARATHGKILFHLSIRFFGLSPWPRLPGGRQERRPRRPRRMPRPSPGPYRKQPQWRSHPHGYGGGKGGPPPGSTSASTSRKSLAISPGLRIRNARWSPGRERVLSVRRRGEECGVCFQCSWIELCPI